MDRDAFVETQLKLLTLEYEAEIEKTREYQKNLKLIELVRQGVCIHKLRCNSIRTGLFRRTLITFGNNRTDQPLPAHKITTGDIVSVNYGNNDQEPLSSGVVYSLNSTSICVAFDKESNVSVDQDYTNFCIIKLSNDVTYRRLKKALLSLRNYPVGGRSHVLIDILFGKKEPSRPLDTDSIEFFNDKLDQSQRDAVHFALSQREVCIIHGPPGTGKTTTLVETILQLVKKDLKVLVCAPSNVAIDNLVEKLASHKTRNMIRLGHPARASTDLQKFTLDAAMSRSDENYIIEDIRQEIDGLRSARDRGKRSQIYDLMKDLKQRERSIIKRVLSATNIVLSTLTSASPEGPLKHIVRDPDHQFDVLVIDECSQALETACWIPLPLVEKCILAGDHYQLPPTIISETAAKDGLELTLMERLLNQFEHEKVVRMLTMQYRMHQDIMEWSSKKFYSDKLVAHESVRDQSMNEISCLKDCPTLLLIDTSGCDMPELDVEDEESKGNENEADIAAAYVLNLIENNVKPENIGVITPYNLQVELIRLRLNDKYPMVEIRSVDGFQGREKEVIILSLVRSNDQHQTGFLAEYRRINVAVTRAKKHLVVICDSETVSAESHLASLMDYLNEKGEVKSAHEYQPQMELFRNIERPQHLRFKEVKKTIPVEAKKKNKVIEKGSKSMTKKPQNLKNEQPSNPEAVKTAKSDKDDLLIKRMRDKIANFVKNSRKEELIFPSNLTSFERRLVHSIAEEMKLFHVSHGEGDDRYIVIRKPVSSNLVAEEEREVEISTESDTDSKSQEQNKEEPCKSDLNIAAQKTKKSSNRSKSKKKPHPEVVESVPHVSKSKEKKKDPSTVLTKSADLTSKLESLDDFDEMLSFVKKMDGICFYVNCKTKTRTLGQQCQFCNKRFCLTHSMPEIHGCGDAVRNYARSIVRKEGKLYPGLGLPDRKPDPVKRNNLEKKLNKKLEAMSAKRKTQSKKE